MTISPDNDVFGEDYSTIMPDGTIDIDLAFQPIRGVRVIAEQVARVWTMAKGSAFWAPNAGLDIRTLVNADFDARMMAHWEKRLEAQARRVDGVKSIKVTITLDAATETLRIEGALVTTQGTGRLLLTTQEAANAVAVFFQEAA